MSVYKIRLGLTQLTNNPYFNFLQSLIPFKIYVKLNLTSVKRHNNKTKQPSYLLYLIMTVGLARKLSRTKAHRDALLRNLVTQLFQHESLITTHEKCKETAIIAERIITSAKKYNRGKGSPRHISNIQSHLFLSGDNKHLLSKVTNDLTERYKGRRGGFTRILKLEPRMGDKAKQSTIELVDTPILQKVDQDHIVMQRGNIKFWLLMKTLLYNEINNEVYSSNTLQNLKKLYKSKQGDLSQLSQFKQEMLAVRKLLMEQMNQSDLKNDPKGRSFTYNGEQENMQIDYIISRLKELELSQVKSSKPKYGGNRKDKTGFQFMKSRPERAVQL